MGCGSIGELDFVDCVQVHEVYTQPLAIGAGSLGAASMVQLRVKVTIHRQAGREQKCAPHAQVVALLLRQLPQGHVLWGQSSRPGQAGNKNTIRRYFASRENGEVHLMLLFVLTFPFYIPSF